MHPCKHVPISEYQPVDIEFKDLNYSVRDKLKDKGYKNLLQSVSGTFWSGNLTAILGSSGAGKSTLLNVLAGYVTSGVTGSIYVNGAPRTMKSFKKISAYIMQGDLIQPCFSVQESMMIVANLKLGSDLSRQDKLETVRDIISTLGLERSLDTRTEHLSGGQRKRLSIALELVNNPPVIFLDEPITGVDDVASKYCVKLLKSLAEQGRTVICTIHQPSDSIFQLFDNVYFMAESRCTYNGPVKDLVPFLSSVGFPCPLTHSPSDYIIELSALQPKNIDILSSRVAESENEIESKHVFSTNETQFSNFRSSFLRQFIILSKRNLVQMGRNRLSLFIQLVCHIFVSVSIGCCGYGVGKDAALAFTSFKMIVAVLMFSVYAYILQPVLLYPSERKILEREYFNRWYSLKAYYCSLMLAPLPSMIVTATLFGSIVYVMTDQPMDVQRFLYFIIAGFLVGLTSHSLGVMTASIFETQAGSIVSTGIIAPAYILAIYGMGSGPDIHPIWKAVMHFNYARYGLVAMCDAVYNDRANLECSDIYCHYVDPKSLMISMGMDGTSYVVQVAALVGFLVVFEYLAYAALKFRLNPENSWKRRNFGRNRFQF